MLTKEEILEALAESLLPLEVMSCTMMDKDVFCPLLKGAILLSLERGRDIIRRNFEEKQAILLKTQQKQIVLYSEH